MILCCHLEAIPVTVSLMSCIVQTLQLYIKNFLFLSFRPAEVQKSQSANIQIHLKSQILLSKK